MRKRQNKLLPTKDSMQFQWLKMFLNKHLGIQAVLSTLRKPTTEIMMQFVSNIEQKMAWGGMSIGYLVVMEEQVQDTESACKKNCQGDLENYTFWNLLC